MTTTPIADQVVELGAKSAARLPADVLAAFAREQSALDAAGVPAGAARPGGVLPDAALLDVHGEPTSLHRALAGRPAVIVLYRGAWCPFCNLTLHTCQEHLVAALAERGAVLVAISRRRRTGR